MPAKICGEALTFNTSTATSLPLTDLGEIAALNSLAVPRLS
ncbi:MAG TPA: hypothetical protein VFE51_21070 [Verrucomicrobiae bacterium]|nr:hypothetical protein [Verrucomicrobiae bacterium]